MKRLVVKETSTPTIAELQAEIVKLQERNHIILKRSKHWRKQAKKYKNLCTKLLQQQIKFNKQSE